MNRKIFIVLALAVFVYGLTAPGVAIAGEKQKTKAHGASYTTTVNQLEVGDEDGHLLVIFENRAIYFVENSGEKFADRSVAFMDMNPNKPAEIYMTGYGVHTDKDGDKMIRSFKGKPISKEQWKGVYSVTGGTGKFVGATGGGSWTSTMLAPKQSFVEVEGELEIP